MSTQSVKKSIRHDGDEPHEVVVPIYRKVVLGDITVGGGRDSFETAALHTIAEIVGASQRSSGSEDGIVNDTIETEFEGHRIQVRLGEHVEYQS